MVRNVVIVHHDGETETLPVTFFKDGYPPKWLYRLYRGDVRKAFSREGEGSAFREFGSVENRWGETTESALVYLERPVKAYLEERDRVERGTHPENVSREVERLERCRESAVRDLALMPDKPEWVSCFRQVGSRYERLP